MLFLSAKIKVQKDNPIKLKAGIVAKPITWKYFIEKYAYNALNNWTAIQEVYNWLA